MAKKLDTMLDSVIQRGIYVVQQNPEGYYTVSNINNSQVAVEWIPSKKQAQAVCSNLNSRRYMPGRERLREASLKFRRYSRLSNDCIQYIHVLDNTDDTVLRMAITARLQHARAVLEQITRSLASLM